MIFLSVLNWIVVGAALLGAYLNSKQKIEGFFLWVISNSYLLAYNLAIGEYSQGILFLAYLAITINGIAVWSKNKQKTYTVEKQ